MRRNYYLTTILIFCTWLNALPVAAQSKSAKPAKEIKAAIPSATDPSVIFANLKKDDGIFSGLLTKMNGGDPDTANALEAQGVYFYDRLREQAADQMAKTVEKAREANKKRYEQLRQKGPVVKNGGVKPVPPAKGPVKPIPPARKTATIKYDTVPAGRGTHVFRNAAFSPDGEGMLIQKTETENGINISGAETKTIETAEGTVVRRASGDSKITFDGKQMSTEMATNQKIEAVSKTSGQKLTKTAKMGWGAALDVCPDAEGIIRGTAKAHVYSQNLIHTGRDIAAMTTEYQFDVKITGYVNDAAEMTHFDMEGTLTETTFGYDRALDHGIVDDTKGIEDGKATLILTITNSTPPSTAEANEYGWKKDISPKLGETKLQSYDEISGVQGKRMGEMCGWGILGTMIDLENLMRSSMWSWKNGECVDVECVPAKPALKAGEVVDITATAVSKQDLSKINADQKAFGTESVTPEEQRGEPAAVYSLTAPKAGETAYIQVTATSRRGIGTGTWEYVIPKPKRKPPVKAPPPPKHVDPIWTGSISAVHTEKEEEEKPPSGRMKYEKTVKSNRWEVVLTVDGTRDLSGGIVNNFYAETEVMYTGRDYRETAYAPGKMSCSPGPIITSPETRKHEMIDNGVGHQRLLVTITVIGARGYLSFGAPGINAERAFIVKYETNCAPYNATNSKTYQEPRGVSVGSPGFEVSFEADPAKPNEVQGTKTVTNSDGSETVYTWNLKRGK